MIIIDGTIARLKDVILFAQFTWLLTVLISVAIIAVIGDCPVR